MTYKEAEEQHSLIIIKIKESKNDEEKKDLTEKLDNLKDLMRSF